MLIVFVWKYWLKISVKLYRELLFTTDKSTSSKHISPSKKYQNKFQCRKRVKLNMVPLSSSPYLLECKAYQVQHCNDDKWPDIHPHCDTTQSSVERTSTSNPMMVILTIRKSNTSLIQFLNTRKQAHSVVLHYFIYKKPLNKKPVPFAKKLL